MIDGSVKQDHHVLMLSTGTVVEPNQTLPGRETSHPRPKRHLRRKLSSKAPGEPSFYLVRLLKGSAPGYHRQRSYETVAVAILKATLHPIALAGNATARIPQQVRVPEWCLMRIVERHVASPCQMIYRYYEAGGKE